MFKVLNIDQITSGETTPDSRVLARRTLLQLSLLNGLPLFPLVDAATLPVHVVTCFRSSSILGVLSSIEGSTCMGLINLQSEAEMPCICSGGRAPCQPTSKLIGELYGYEITPQ